jgi:hypothetical protein
MGERSCTRTNNVNIGHRGCSGDHRDRRLRVATPDGCRLVRPLGRCNARFRIGGSRLASAHRPRSGLLDHPCAGVVVGVVNGFVVVNLGVDSFIATLGMSSILAAFTYWLIRGLQIVGGISPAFLNIARPTYCLPLPPCSSGRPRSNPVVRTCSGRSSPSICW